MTFPTYCTCAIHDTCQAAVACPRRTLCCVRSPSPPPPPSSPPCPIDCARSGSTRVSVRPSIRRDALPAKKYANTETRLTTCQGFRIIRLKQIRWVVFLFVGWLMLFVFATRINPCITAAHAAICIPQANAMVRGAASATQFIPPPFD